MADVRRAAAARGLSVVLRHKPPRARRFFMTPRFVVHSVLSFYDCLNARALKRKLVEFYSANALMCESTLAWTVAAVPRCRWLRSLMLTALDQFLDSAVADMQRRVLLYSGSAIRGDGNYDLAARVGKRSPCGRYVVPVGTVALGWTGVDGA